MTYCIRWVCLASICAATALSAVDPVPEFLQATPPYIREQGIYYSDDKLLRLDLDLNNDGQVEMLLSLARDRDGRQGNIWAIYKASADGYSKAGTMTFSPDRFYVGNIDEIGRYGLVTFGPAGAGEGALLALVFDGSSIQQVQIAAVSRDVQTPESAGQALLNKYLGENAAGTRPIVTEAAELARKYGITVQQKTYREAAQQLLLAQNPAVDQSALSPGISPVAAPSVAPAATETVHPAQPVLHQISPSPASSPPPAKLQSPGRDTRMSLFWLLGGGMALLAVLFWASKRWR